jgi:uncharacterized protein YbbC (DUF1343 family)
VTASLHLIATVRDLYPERFAWRERSTEGASPHFDLLAGTDKVRRALDGGVDVDDLVASWSGELAQFARESRRFHLYH